MWCVWFLGVCLDAHANESHRPVISSEQSKITVLVLPTNEEEEMAKHVVDMLT